MHNFSKLTIAALAALALSGTPSFAQVQANADIAAACTITPAECSALVSAKIAALRAQGLSAAEIDAELADLVIELAQAGQTLPADVRSQISAAISVAQAAIVDPELALQVAAINSAFAAGEPFQTAALGDEASPN